MKTKGKKVNFKGTTPQGADSLLGFAKTLSKEYSLKHIVFHEILHSWLGVEHDETSKLMSATLNSKMTSKQIDREFIKFVKKSLKIK